MDYDVGLLLQISSIGCNLFIVARCSFARRVLVPLVLSSFSCTFLRSDRVQNILWFLTRAEHIIITTTTFAVVDESVGERTRTSSEVNLMAKEQRLSCYSIGF